MDDWLTTLLAGLLAAQAAFLANRAFLVALAEEPGPGGAEGRSGAGAGRRADAPGMRPGALLVSAVPAAEEAAKDLAALLSGADLLGTHVVFGLAEAGFEAVVGEWRGFVAGVFGLLGHALFGAATRAAFTATGSLFLAAGAGIALHIAWNAAALRLGRRE